MRPVGGTKTGRFRSSLPPIMLKIGDLVTHRKKPHLGTGRVIRSALAFDTESDSDMECRVLVEWERGIASLDEPLRWPVSGGHHLFDNAEGKRGIHQSGDLDKLDLITAIGKLDP